MRLALLAALAFAVSLASAASIHGIVYDADLEPVDGAVVQVDTAPIQRVVARNGSYSFEVPPGNYTLSATYSAGERHYSTQENLSVQSEGEFTLDLVFLSFAPPEEIEVEQLPEDLPQTGFTPSPSQNSVFDALLFVLVSAFVFLAIAFALLKTMRASRLEKPARRPQKKTAAVPPVVVTPSQRQLLEQLEKAGGRTTQKELRRLLPNASEAGVSMDLTELEDAGIIKKIKKGRGNIIKLVSPEKP